MQLLLFDQHPTGGHHLEYMDRLCSEIESNYNINVDILTTCYDSTQEMYFNNNNLYYLYDESSQVETLQSGRTLAFDTVDWISNRGYDVIHYLHGDDILPWLADALNETEPANVVSFNGNFFGYPSKPIQRLHEISHSVLSTPLLNHILFQGYRSMALALPKTVQSRAPDWFDLYSCFHQDLIDHLFVTTHRARDLVRAIARDAPVTVAPDPIDTYYDYPGKIASRKRLDLNIDGTLLLFFGQTRTEKGIKFLLQALKDYDGPRFTLVIAGPPTDVTAGDINSIRSDIPLPIRTRLEFVDQADVPLYFRAADGILLPYLSTFGAARLSGVFHKACGACRPVLASDFGEIGDRVEQYNLGTTFQTGSESNFRSKLSSWISKLDSFDSTSVQSYSADHTFEKMAKTFVDQYRQLY